MAVDFVSSAGNATAGVGSSSGSLVWAPADCIAMTLNGYSASFCTALFTGLQPATQIYYVRGRTAARDDARRVTRAVLVTLAIALARRR